MKEFKGTKGEWMIHPYASACVCLKDGRIIANCGGYCNSIEFEMIAAENEANAKLITAAPELLEALIKIANWDLPETGKYWDIDKKEPMSYEACFGSNGARDYIKNIAKQAINKALK